MLCLNELGIERIRQGGKNMNKKLGMALLACSILLIPGCAPNEGNSQETEQIKVLQEENSELKKTVDTLEQELAKLKEENESLKEIEAEKSKEIYTLYSRDVNSWEIIEVGEVKLDEGTPLQDKVQAVANELSKVCFEGLEIEVEEIKKIGNNDIAIINLKDKGQEQNPNWMVNFFQGSTGAGITATSLEESLLQRKSSYSWIDGIEIHYNGEALMTDHIEFGKIVYR